MEELLDKGYLYSENDPLLSSAANKDSLNYICHHISSSEVETAIIRTFHKILIQI